MTEAANPNVTGLTRGHKKKARTHQVLVEAALRLFARKDIGSFTMNELAEEAGLANGTIYNYFRTREEVLAAAGIALATQLSEDILKLSSGIQDGAARLVLALRIFIIRARDGAQWAQAVVRVIQLDSGLRSALANYAAHDLRIGKDQGLFDYADFDTAVDCICSFGLAGVRASVEGRAVPGHDVLVAEMVLRALGVSPGKARHYANLPIPEQSAAIELTPPRPRGRPRKVHTA